MDTQHSLDWYSTLDGIDGVALVENIGISFISRPANFGHEVHGNFTTKYLRMYIFLFGFLRFLGDLSFPVVRRSGLPLVRPKKSPKSRPGPHEMILYDPNIDPEGPQNLKKWP